MNLGKSILVPVVGGLFGLAVARAALDTWPLMAGPFPRWPPALLTALAFAAAGLRLSFTRLPTYSFVPFLLPALTLLDPTASPLRDWILVLAAPGGLVVILHTQYSILNIRHSIFRIEHSALFPLSLAVLASALYLRTLAPTVGEADTFEFQVNAIRLGVSHGSGYPLYLILAKVFSLLPLGGTAAFRINLSSAFFGVASALVCYALARALHASRPASWIAGLSLAASIGLWSRAVEAEVYTLHVTLVGALLLIGLRIQEAGGRGQAIGWLSFLFGLALTNHLTSLLLAPAILIAVAPSLLQALRQNHGARSWLRDAGRLFLAAGLCFAIGLSLYLYLPLRWPAVNNGEIMTWDMFMRFFTGAEAHGALRLDAWRADLGRYAIVGRKALDQFGWPGAMAAFIGFAALVRRRPAAALVTLAAWAAFAFFGLSFYVPDPDYSSFLLPAHFVQAVWMGVGITAILHTEYSILKTHRPLVLSAGYCVSFFLFAPLIWINLPKVDQSSDWREYRLGQYILNKPLNEGAAILADSKLIAPLYYLQVAEGLRPDLDIVVLPNEEAYRAELDARVSAGQTVYLGRYLPHLTDVYYLQSVGPLVSASLEPGRLFESLYANVNFGDVILLRIFALDQPRIPYPTDSSIYVTLFWQAIRPPPENYLVSLRLVDSNGVPRLVGPAEAPVGQMYPTTAWPTNDFIADFHEFRLDRSLAPGKYQLQVGLFPPFSEEGLKLPSGEMWQRVAEVTLAEPATGPQIAHPVRMRFGSAWLMGYDAPETAAPGSQVAVTLYWLSREAGAAQLCAGSDCFPVNVRAGNRITETRAALPAPNEAGELSLRIGVPAEKAECGWQPAPPAETCSLARISVEGAPLAPDAINFDNQITLDSIRIETPQAAPGQTVIVAAQWRGLKPMGADYTVFVHLLGPDGIVHGQVDAWPVQGTLPTTQWPVNEPIADRFEVRVPDDAPKGEYKVEVGWYLLATLDRLPVVTPQGVAVDDKYVIGGLVIGN